MKRFITIFPKGTNVHLIKDVGMIPFFLQKEGYYESSIAFYEEQDSLDYLKNEVKGLAYVKISRVFRNENLNIFLFLLINWYKFDVIMFFHMDFVKAMLAMFMKLVTFKRVKFYFKLDANDDIKESKLVKSTGFLRRFKVFVYNKMDLISVETKYIHDFLNRKLSLKAAYIPNGFGFGEETGQGEGYEKENIIALVGRIGAPEKDNQTFLKALEHVHLRDWKVEILGPIEASFQNEISIFFETHPHLSQSVCFRGAIYERSILFDILRKSKIFVQTSKFESFGIALLEAMASGCFIVSTNLTPSKEIAGEFGRFFDVGDYRKLASLLQSVIDENMTLPLASNIINRAQQEYSWSSIVKKIHFCLAN